MCDKVIWLYSEAGQETRNHELRGLKTPKSEGIAPVDIISAVAYLVCVFACSVYDVHRITF